VISQVMFQSGQVMPGLPTIVAAAHSAGARVLLDVYHSLGVFPVDLAALDVDFAVGGSYKYLRGGPGACFLYVAPRHLDSRLATLDTGWFAKESPFTYARPDPPRFAAGGDAWLESTPPVLPLYQARRVSDSRRPSASRGCALYSLELQRSPVDAARRAGVAAQGGTADRGAFVTVRHRAASALATELGRVASRPMRGASGCAFAPTC
jgi:kynureninase